MKKITIVLTILLLSLVTINLSSTNVSGLISTNTTWTKGNSPYIVTNNILVNTGVTLTIEPGVTIKFDTLKSIQIDGELLAQGTSSNKITFTSNTTQTAGAWGYIYFSDASKDAVFLNNIYGTYVSGSILEYCIIQYAGGANVTDNGALRLDGDHPFVNYCTITENSATGINAYNLTGMLKISNSIISHNTSNGGGGGICEDGSGSTLISGNTISNNTASSFGGGIYTNGGSATISNNIISNNTTTDQGGGGIFPYTGTITISNNIIINNRANGHYGGGGIFTWGATSTISNNIISNNSAFQDGGGIYQGDIIINNIIADNIATNTGGGVFTSGSLTTNNHIIRNTATDYAGIKSVQNSSDIKFNTIAYNGNTDLNNHSNTTIYITNNPGINNNNIFNNSAFYEMYNGNAQGTTNLAATNNWWGTSDDATIQTKIYDWFDNNTLGIVNYSPYVITPDTLAPVSPPVNVSKTNIGGGQVKITWNKNPESDIAGYHVYYGGFTGYSFTNMINVAGKADTSYILTGVSINDTIAVTAYDRTYSIANELDSTIVNDNMTNGNESWFSYAKASSQTGLESGIINTVNIYPNPVSNAFQLIGIEGTATITLTDVSGRLLISKEVITNETVSVSTLPNGIYLAAIKSNNTKKTEKLIIQR